MIDSTLISSNYLLLRTKHRYVFIHIIAMIIYGCLPYLYLFSNQYSIFVLILIDETLLIIYVVYSQYYYVTLYTESMFM